MNVQRQTFQEFLTEVENEIKKHQLVIEVFNRDARLLQVQTRPGEETVELSEARDFVRNEKTKDIEDARRKIGELVSKWFFELSKRYFSVKDKTDISSKQLVVFYNSKLDDFRERFPNFALV